MNYKVIELQTNGETTAHIVTTETDQPHAEQKFHTVMAAAAVSNVDIHACVILNEFGAIVQQGYYSHGVNLGGE
jgi:hypothetical protein